MLDRLFRLWRASPSQEIRRDAAWAFSHLPLVPRESNPLGESHEWQGFISTAKQRYSEPLSHTESGAIVVAAYYLRAPWTDHELVELARQQRHRYIAEPTMADLEAALAAQPGSPEARFSANPPRIKRIKTAKKP